MWILRNITKTRRLLKNGVKVCTGRFVYFLRVMTSYQENIRLLIAVKMLNVSCWWKIANKISLSVNITTFIVSQNIIIDNIEGYNYVAWTSLHWALPWCGRVRHTGTNVKMGYEKLNRWIFLVNYNESQRKQAIFLVWRHKLRWFPEVAQEWPLNFIFQHFTM